MRGSLMLVLVLLTGCSPFGPDSHDFIIAADSVVGPAAVPGQALTIQPPVTDPFVLRVHQPDKSVLSKTIRAQ